MKKLFTLLCAVALGTHAYVQAVDNNKFSQSNDFKTELEKHKAAQQAEFDKFLNDHKKEFELYRDEFRDGLAAYKNEVKGVWGYAEVSTNSKWVHYSQDLSEKLVVDFENNTVALQRGGPKTEQESVAFVEATLQQSVGKQTIAESLGISATEVKTVAKQLVDEKNKADDAEFIKSNIKDLQKTKAKLQVESSKLEPKEQQAEQAYIAKIDKEIKNTQALLKSAHAPTKKKVSTKLKLGDKRVQRANLYREQVQKQSQSHGIPQALIYAVMEVESSFNPKAQSPIPAFGLMQIVPSTAGADVHRYLNFKSRLPTPEELYQPPKNVLMGTAYLAMLYRTYFKDVTDPLSKSYCVIAAYNTGMGNVAAIFNKNGLKRLDKAAKVINKLTPQQVHDKIKQNAHPETQRYITKVLNAQAYFKQHI